MFNVISSKGKTKGKAKGKAKGIAKGERPKVKPKVRAGVAKTKNGNIYYSPVAPTRRTVNKYGNVTYYTNTGNPAFKIVRGDDDDREATLLVVGEHSWWVNFSCGRGLENPSIDFTYHQ